MKPSFFFPEHICKTIGAIMDPDEEGYFNRVNPKFVKWMTVARFKYDCPDMILELAEQISTYHDKFYYYGWTVDSEIITIKFTFINNFPSLLLCIMTDYLESCNLHCYSITAGCSGSRGQCYIQFSFKQSPSQ